MFEKLSILPVRDGITPVPVSRESKALDGKAQDDIADKFLKSKHPTQRMFGVVAKRFTKNAELIKDLQCKIAELQKTLQAADARAERHASHLRRLQDSVSGLKSKQQTIA